MSMEVDWWIWVTIDKYQLEPRNCVFLDDIEDNTRLDVKSHEAVDVLKKLNKQKTLYLFCGGEFFVNKILQNDSYILH